MNGFLESAVAYMENHVVAYEHADMVRLCADPLLFTLTQRVIWTVNNPDYAFVYFVAPDEVMTESGEIVPWGAEEDTFTYRPLNRTSTWAYHRIFRHVLIYGVQTPIYAPLPDDLEPFPQYTLSPSKIATLNTVAPDWWFIFGRDLMPRAIRCCTLPAYLERVWNAVIVYHTSLILSYAGCLVVNPHAPTELLHRVAAHLAPYPVRLAEYQAHPNWGE